MNRLLLRRQLAQRHSDIQSRINQMATMKEVNSRIQGDKDSGVLKMVAMLEESKCQVQALRIASQDEGHAVLLKRSSSSNETLTRLQGYLFN